MTAHLRYLSAAVAAVALLVAQQPMDNSVERKKTAARPTQAVQPEALVDGTPMPTGFSITPTAAPGSVFAQMNPNLPGLPDYRAGQPMTTAVSPDGKLMLVLTSGFLRGGA